MRTLPLLLLLTTFHPFFSRSQTPDNKATDAYLITRMVEKFHVQPRPLDKTMSAAIYSRMLQTLDEDRIFLIQSDIVKLSVYRNTLDEEIANKRTGFLQLLTSLYQQ